MKKSVCSWVVAGLLLSSCSLLQRNTEDLEGDSSPPFDPAESAQTLGGEFSSGNAAGMESEVSRLNTRISALETKLEVLTSNIERNQIKRSQPIIEAEPEPNMAAPVEEATAEAPTVELSAAPARPNPPPAAPRTEKPSMGSEREFQSAMEFFQGGKNLEAASKFALFAKKYPRHLMASHALYWAGEASARAQQWSLALENWEELERRYPRSAYLPEALAGIAKANEQQGDPNKARAYRDTLLKAFPKSPVALSLRPGQASVSTRSAPAAEREEIPSYEDTSGEEAVTE
jgi:TolA-binding protein